MNQAMRQLARRVEALGYRVTSTRNNHVRVDAPLGVVFLPSTPSDSRSIANAVALLRRKGIPL